MTRPIRLLLFLAPCFSKHEKRLHELFQTDSTPGSRCLLMEGSVHDSHAYFDRRAETSLVVDGCWQPEAIDFSAGHFARSAA